MTEALTKSDLRRRMRALRHHLAEASPDAAAQAAGRLPAQRLSRPGVVSGYHPYGGELDPWPLLRRFEAAGWRIALPAATSRTEPLVFRAFDPDAALERDAVNIPSPPAHAQALVPDVVIAPLLAFDRRGFRLGQGAGHYDRTLAALRPHHGVFVIALAYAGQEVEQVPSDPFDQPVDAILTEISYRAVHEEF